MTYLNGSPCIVRTPEYMRATPAQRSIWFQLWCYCHEHDNSGKIGNCEDWTDDMWRGLLIDPEIVRKDCPLWRHAGLMLVVHFYNLDAEKNHLTKVRKGREYAMRRWEKANQIKPVKDGSPIPLPKALPNG